MKTKNGDGLSISFFLFNNKDQIKKNNNSTPKSNINKIGKPTNGTQTNIKLVYKGVRKNILRSIPNAKINRIILKTIHLHNTIIFFNFNNLF